MKVKGDVNEVEMLDNLNIVVDTKFTKFLSFDMAATSVVYDVD